MQCKLMPMACKSVLFVAPVSMHSRLSTVGAQNPSSENRTPFQYPTFQCSDFEPFSSPFCSDFDAILFRFRSVGTERKIYGKPRLFYK